MPVFAKALPPSLVPSLNPLMAVQAPFQYLPAATDAVEFTDAMVQVMEVAGIWVQTKMQS